jgi:hypothetical protein
VKHGGQQQQQQQQGVHLDLNHIHDLIMELQLSRPALNMRLLAKQEDVVVHVVNLARQLARQPYMSWRERMEALAKDKDHASKPFCMQSVAVVAELLLAKCLIEIRDLMQAYWYPKWHLWLLSEHDEESVLQAM